MKQQLIRVGESDIDDTGIGGERTQTLIKECPDFEAVRSCEVRKDQRSFLSEDFFELISKTEDQ